VIVVICKGSTQLLQALQYCSSAPFCLLSPYPPLSQLATGCSWPGPLPLCHLSPRHLISRRPLSRSTYKAASESLPRLPPTSPSAADFPPFISHLQTRPTRMVFYNLKALIKAIRATKTIADERALIVKESAVIRTSFKEEGESRDELGRVGT